MELSGGKKISITEYPDSRRYKRFPEGQGRSAICGLGIRVSRDDSNNCDWRMLKDGKSYSVS